jgi:hypothetical protein
MTKEEMGKRMDYLAESGGPYSEAQYILAATVTAAGSFSTI